jgi:hypothetical protein
MPSINDRDGSLGASPDGGFHLRAQFLRWLLLENVEEVVVAHLEDLRGRSHAESIGFTQIEIDDNSHRPNVPTPDPSCG